MSWYFPKHTYELTDLVDATSFNETLAALAGELDGHLNEHNWVSDTLQQRMQDDLVADDIALTVYYTEEDVSPIGATSAMFDVPQSVSWVPVDDTDVTWTSKYGGQINVICEFQLVCPSVLSNQTGLVFAVEVDGVPQPSSLLGTGDQSNDFITTGAHITPGGGAVTFDFGTSPSNRAKFWKGRAKCLMRIEPGQHTVRLVCRNLATAQTKPSQFIASRQTVVIEGYC